MKKTKQNLAENIFKKIYLRSVSWMLLLFAHQTKTGNSTHRHLLITSLSVLRLNWKFKNAPIPSTTVNHSFACTHMRKDYMFVWGLSCTEGHAGFYHEQEYVNTADRLCATLSE